MVKIFYKLIRIIKKIKFKCNKFFSVPSTKIKVNDDNEVSKSEGDIQREEINSSDKHFNEVRIGQQEESNSVIENVEENISNFKNELNIEEEMNNSKSNNESKENEEEVNLLSQIILEKLKFLSEGKPGVLPVQLMSIQLQVNKILISIFNYIITISL